MTRWNLALLATDYLNFRRRQLGREPNEWEIRGINGFAEYLILLEGMGERKETTEWRHPTQPCLDATDMQERPEENP